MSIGLLVVGSIACLLVMGLLGALYVLSKVEGAHEERVGIRTADRPKRSGSSGDLHLFLALPDAEAAGLRGLVQSLGDKGVVPPERFGELAAQLPGLLERATHGHAEYGHFRRIKAQGVPGTALLYLNVRSRKPIEDMLDLHSRAQWQRTLGDLGVLGPEQVIEAFVEVQTPSTDPALGRPVALA